MADVRRDRLAIAHCPKCGAQFRERHKEQIGKPCGGMNSQHEKCDGIIKAGALPDPKAKKEGLTDPKAKE